MRPITIDEVMRVSAPDAENPAPYLQKLNGLVLISRLRPERQDNRRQHG